MLTMMNVSEMDISTHCWYDYHSFTQLCMWLMYKTAVYALVNGVITHQTSNIKKCNISSMTLPKCQCTAAQYHRFDICCFW